MFNSSFNIDLLSAYVKGVLNLYPIPNPAALLFFVSGKS